MDEACFERFWLMSRVKKLRAAYLLEEALRLDELARTKADDEQRAFAEMNRRIHPHLKADFAILQSELAAWVAAVRGELNVKIPQNMTLIVGLLACTSKISKHYARWFGVAHISMLTGHGPNFVRIACSEPEVQIVWHAPYKTLLCFEDVVLGV